MFVNQSGMMSSDGMVIIAFFTFSSPYRQMMSSDGMVIIAVSTFSSPYG